ncbi:trypco2 family protein [uncultured Bacteroides sp.]|uniref:trypco2 family protein n=1 Tax=uncultured Bacteroides sp. TaxID=162156 RepID=UPI002AA83A9F|nr:trypco2 family protein [uncultured Bacteroides sp.]
MNLKDFIKEAIADISNAISELNSENESSGLIVNPCDFTDYNNKGRYLNDGRNVHEIEFNLSVSAGELVEKGGGIKINVLKAGINNEVNNSEISTVKFSILVVYPSL